MIPLTRLNGSQIYINCDLIKYAEASPDTMLTLIHGEKIVVLESCEQVIERITEYRIRILRAIGQNAASAAGSQSASAAAGVHAALDYLAEERKDTIVPDPAAVHRRRPQSF